MLDKKQLNLIRLGVLAALALGSFVVGFARSSHYDYPVYETAQSIAIAAYATPTPTPTPNLEEDPRETEQMCIARLLQGIDSNSVDDKKTYGLCAIIRSLKYDVSIESVVNKPLQWINYNPDVTVTQENYNIAGELLDIRDSKVLPVGLEFEFADWSPNKVVLKNDLNNPTKTWWWSKA